MNSIHIVPQQTDFKALFSEHQQLITAGDLPLVSDMRKAAIEAFHAAGFPSQAMEAWKNTDLSAVLSEKYLYSFSPPAEKTDIDKIFRCEIHNFETYLFTLLNGWYIFKQAPISKLPNGVVTGSIQAAMEGYPEIIGKHYGKYALPETNGLIALNNAFARDGFFIYIPDNVVVEKPIQIVSIVNHQENLFIQPRNIVITGKNSKLTLVHCDDSISHKSSFINSVTEVYAGEGSNIDYYKLQNKDDQAAIITSSFFYLEKDSTLNTNTITLNGGLIRNDTRVHIAGKGSHAGIYGLYLMDRKQHVDNQVYVDHEVPDTTSYELFKGIIDDDASAVFNGHILVRRDAQHTQAYQNNRNILLTDTARVSTKPFLEIYADDVKCSHGATVGQLDPEALFYLKSRGICDRNAKMLLMYAFASEAVNKINIEVLRERIDNMIVKRLKGELSICDQCVLHCKENDMPVFDIDMSKV